MEWPRGILGVGTGMGDFSSEPSMEEILSSIKRIIAEEGDVAVSTRARRAPRPTAVSRTASPASLLGDDEVLELSDPVAAEDIPQPHAPEQQPLTMGAPTPPEAAKADPILSDRAAEATRGPLEALSRMVVKPTVPGSDTLEGLVRSLIKPMLSEWLDANLPQIVEEMVAREITRITGNK